MMRFWGRKVARGPVSGQAAHWYTRHEEGADLSPDEWREWEAWSENPAHGAEYDAFVRLHEQLRQIPRPALSRHQAAIGAASAGTDGAASRGIERREASDRSRRPIALATTAAVILLVVVTVLLSNLLTHGRSPLHAHESTSAAPTLPFSEAALASLRASGHPVLVNLRAGWCAACVVNERTALSPDVVRRAMVRKGVVYLKGEWTGRDDPVSATLHRFGRPGVPLYLLYCPKAKVPVVLPEVLTEDIVLSALSRLPDRNLSGT